MIVCEIYGGLGNQLFEYANARSLAIKLNQELSFDLSFFNRYKEPDVYRLDKFNTLINVASDNDINHLKRKELKPYLVRAISRKLLGTPYKNSKYHFDEEWFDINELKSLLLLKNIYISGYFGNEKYFKDHEIIIRNEFTLRDELNIENQKVILKIQGENSVSVHIRRGDYVNNPYFEELSAAYYLKAINYIEEIIPDPVFYFFSDDLSWVKKNININGGKAFFCDINDLKNGYKDLMLMAECKHNIIANSTFSWWAAWLNQNPDKTVIAPYKWYNYPNAQKQYESGSFIPSKWNKI